jgi:hypothetical protein
MKKLKIFLDFKYAPSTTPNYLCIALSICDDPSHGVLGFLYNPTRRNNDY